MKVTQFSEWVANRHPDFEVNEGLFDSRPERRLATAVASDREKMGPTTTPLPEGSTIVGLARELAGRISREIGEMDADAITAASIRAAQKTQMVDPRTAQNIFLALALRGNSTMGIEAAAKGLMSVMDSMQRRGLTSLRAIEREDQKRISRLMRTQEVSQRDRQRIGELFSHFLNAITGPGSGPSATPLA